MVDRAIDFNRYRQRRDKRREQQQLRARVVQLAGAQVKWHLDAKIKALMRENFIDISDLIHVIETAVVIRLGRNNDELCIDGYTADEIFLRLYLLDHSKHSSPSLTCLDGKIITDEEGLVV